MLGLKPLPPEYVPVIEWDPGASVEIVKAATLLETAAVPNEIAPSKN